jgi:serine/threonine-protein kinase HipA
VSNELIALLEGKQIGRVHKNARGGINFLYDDEWRKDPAAYPLSLSMPLGAKEHGRSWPSAPEPVHCPAKGPIRKPQ